jgi:hypothetical protein
LHGIVGALDTITSQGVSAHKHWSTLALLEFLPVAENMKEMILEILQNPSSSEASGTLVTTAPRLTMLFYYIAS